jgi:hypothetical protein
MGPGKDIVTDWQEGDHLAIFKPGGGFADLRTATITQSGADTLVSYQSGTETWLMTLKNTLSSSISIADDFITA